MLKFILLLSVCLNCLYVQSQPGNSIFYSNVGTGDTIWDYTYDLSEYCVFDSAELTIDFDVYAVPDAITIFNSTWDTILTTQWVGCNMYFLYANQPCYDGFLFVSDDTLYQDTSFTPSDGLLYDPPIKYATSARNTIGRMVFMVYESMFRIRISVNGKGNSQGILWVHPPVVFNPVRDTLYLDTVLYACDDFYDSYIEYHNGECRDTQYFVTQIPIDDLSPEDTVVCAGAVVPLWINSLDHSNITYIEWSNGQHGTSYVSVNQDTTFFVYIVAGDCSLEFKRRIQILGNSLVDSFYVRPNSTLYVDSPPGANYFYGGGLYHFISVDVLDEDVVFDVLVEHGECRYVKTFYVLVLGDVYIPTAFSPNGDGINDVFKIYYNRFHILRITSFEIYHRWGGLVYKENGPEVLGWEPGSEFSSTVYVCKVIWIDRRGQVQEKYGEFTLVK